MPELPGKDCVSKYISNPAGEIPSAQVTIEGLDGLRHNQGHELTQRPSS